MRAVVMHEFGPPSVLVNSEVAEPVAPASDAMIDVEFASVTFVETQIRAGTPPHPSMLPRLPAILGNGVGGVWHGRRVIASLNGTGGYAERAVAPLEGLVTVPDELRTEDAVALLADGRTAMMLVRAAAIQPGDTVLITAAAGGVGGLLVQLARNAGARVVGAAGGERKLAIARDLGANLALDYLDPAWTTRARAEGISLVLDGVGGSIGLAAFDVLGSGGRYYPFGMSSGSFAQISDADAETRKVSVIRGGRPTPDELRELVRAALAEAVAGRLRSSIGQIVPLERAADAHAAIEQRLTVGKTLLHCSTV
jgi:NADPH2:quinone reductase